ncbi:hypothetical protein [Clostridium botulinum]|uniref:hypothetical protein n=1 Tax=Clostridium botulinum TaxID=1491 RepID=UPI0009475D76|nr:hypothetical protein [Clostridium botulinum]APQ96446.1 hypothetical protein RSJ3_1283 [Clostridium botulinum]MBN3362126.1 hypothetical protein [Clostridium botulinum]
MIDILQKKEEKSKRLVTKLKELGQTQEGITIYNVDTDVFIQLQNFNVEETENNIYLTGQAFYSDTAMSDIGIDCIPIKEYTLTITKIGLLDWRKENCGELILEYLDREVMVECDDEVLWREEDEEHSKMESLAKVEMYQRGGLDYCELTDQEQEEVYRQYYTDLYKNQGNTNNPNFY